MSSTSRPIIGITTYGKNKEKEYFLPAEYVEAVQSAGGFPILLPPGKTDPRTVLELVDGLIFSGGGDIDPKLYRGFPHPMIERIDPERDAFEMELARLISKTSTPVLGICRGMQVLNVASGGSLIEHLPDVAGNQVPHRSPTGKAVEHFVTLEPESRFREILNETSVPVQSWHHQALREIPNAWTIVARSDDNLVEALEHRTHPWMLAVLWHPEMSYQAEHHRRLFRALVEAAMQLGTMKRR
ncbi:MAG: gamma-glutamyl-gamma-aminobutyrate hydrolase family protein [Bacteroidota bacterium]